MNFFSSGVENNDDEFFISGEEKINDFLRFYSCVPPFIHK